MKRILFRAIVVAILAVVIISCGPRPPRTVSEEGERCIPRDLVIDSTAANFALLAWDPGCPGVRILRGFNIYASPVSLTAEYPGSHLPATIQPVNADVYPGDTLGNPGRETYALEDIDNATAYYVHVRAVNSDGSLSPPSNEIRVVTYPQGEFTLRESYTGENDGFSIVTGDYCRTDDLINDVYFYYKDGQDFLCSPIRIGVIYRDTRIYAAGETAPANWERMEPNDLFGERVLVEPGDVYILILEDGYPAKLEVKSIEGVGESRAITFDYIYKPPVKDASSAK